MSTTKSKRSLAMKKRWKEKKAREAAGRVAEKPEGQSINYNTATQETPQEILESRVKYFENKLNDTLDEMISRRDDLALQLDYLNKQIKIRRIQLSLD